MQYFEKKEKMMFNQDQKKKRMSIAERAGKKRCEIDVVPRLSRV